MRIPATGLICPQCKYVIPPDPGFSSIVTRHRLRQAQYDAIGKRCCNCHEYKPLTEYNKSVQCSDGLQPICRDCAKLNFNLRIVGGPPLVKSTRAALQLKNDALNKAAGRP